MGARDTSIFKVEETGLSAKQKVRKKEKQEKRKKYQHPQNYHWIIWNKKNKKQIYDLCEPVWQELQQLQRIRLTNNPCPEYWNMEDVWYKHVQS